MRALAVLRHVVDQPAAVGQADPDALGSQDLLQALHLPAQPGAHFGPAQQRTQILEAVHGLHLQVPPLGPATHRQDLPGDRGPDAHRRAALRELPGPPVHVQPVPDLRQDRHGPRADQPRREVVQADRHGPVRLGLDPRVAAMVVPLGPSAGTDARGAVGLPAPGRGRRPRITRHDAPVGFALPALEPVLAGAVLEMPVHFVPADARDLGQVLEVGFPPDGMGRPCPQRLPGPQDGHGQRRQDDDDDAEEDPQEDHVRRVPLEAVHPREHRVPPSAAAVRAPAGTG